MYGIKDNKDINGGQDSSVIQYKNYNLSSFVVYM